MMLVNIKVYECTMEFDLEDDYDIHFNLTKHHEDVYSFECSDIDDVLYILDYAKFKFSGLNYTVEILK